MSRSLTLLDSGIIDKNSVDKVLQAVVFFADSIAIRASFEIAPTYRERAPSITRRVEELREAGLLKFWSHEYEVDDAGRVTVETALGRTVRPADLVVERVQLSRSLTEMDGIMRTIREEAYRSHGAAIQPLRQGTAEIVGLRNHLASLVIASELDQDGLLTNPAARAALMKNLQRPQSDRFETTVVTDVIARLGLGSLDQLTTDQIIESRRYNADFRVLLGESLLAVARGMDPILTPQATAEELAARYRATVAEFARPELSSAIVSDAMWDLLGSAIPPTMVFKYGLKALKWRKAVNRIRPFLLLMHLERSLHQHKRRSG